MKKLTLDLIEWVRRWFAENGGKTAVVGVSGGKDSLVSIGVLKEALGAENVVGVQMPNGVQPDIADSDRAFEVTGIKKLNVNIRGAYDSIIEGLTKEGLEPEKHSVATINLPARLRMSVLYAVAACVPGGRVITTGNRSEGLLGYTTKWGDSAGDVAPLKNLTVREILEIGDDLGLPYDLVHKVPSDGLSGKTDEEFFGFKYEDIDAYLLDGKELSPEIMTTIERMRKANEHKAKPIPAFEKSE